MGSQAHRKTPPSGLRGDCGSGNVYIWSQLVVEWALLRSLGRHPAQLGGPGGLPLNTFYFNDLALRQADGGLQSVAESIFTRICVIPSNDVKTAMAAMAAMAANIRTEGHHPLLGSLGVSNTMFALSYMR